MNGSRKRAKVILQDGMIGTWSREVMAKACGKSRRSRWLTGDVGIQATALMAHRNFWPISVGGHPEHLLSVQGVCIYTCYRYSVYNVYNMYIVHIIIICVHVYIYICYMFVLSIHTHIIYCVLLCTMMCESVVLYKKSARRYTQKDAQPTSHGLQEMMTVVLVSV